MINMVLMKHGEPVEISAEENVREQVMQRNTDPHSFESASLPRTTIVPASVLAPYKPSLKTESHMYDDANATKSVQRSARVVGLMPAATLAKIKADLMRREQALAKRTKDTSASK